MSEVEIKVIKAYQENEIYRSSFNQLSEETFNLNFEEWYKNGFWGDFYIPYSVIEDDMVVANVSVNIMNFVLAGENRSYIQLGTVMTKKKYRNRGYIRFLMNQIMDDFSDCDGIFLWANDSVLDFYPKFGFEICKEYRYQKAMAMPEHRTVENVPMERRSHWDFFLKEKNKRKSNCICRLDNDDLLMFYLSQFMKENVYYLKELDTYVVAEMDGDTLALHDVYSFGRADLHTVCRVFGDSSPKVRLAFSPVESDGFKRREYKVDNSTFFIKGSRLKEDMKLIGSFSELMHA